MSDITVLRELIKREAIVPLAGTSYDKKSVSLKEEDQYSVEIRGIPKDAIAIKADRFPAPDHVFTCQRGECRRADYVLVTNSNQGSFILYIEIKKGKARSKQIIEQLKGAQCLIAYCREIGRVFWQKKDFLGTRYKSRFVSIREIGLNKHPTIERPEPSDSLNDTPEKMLKIKGFRNLHFKKLTLKDRR